MFDGESNDFAKAEITSPYEDTHAATKEGGEMAERQIAENVSLQCHAKALTRYRNPSTPNVFSYQNIVNNEASNNDQAASIPEQTQGLEVIARRQKLDSIGFINHYERAPQSNYMVVCT